MSSKRRTNSNYIRSQCNLLLNPVASSFVSDDNYLSAIATVAALADERMFDEVWPKLLGQSRVRFGLNCYARRFEDIATKPYFKQDIPFTRLLAFYKGILTREAKAIASFVVLRDSFERALLFGNFDAAQSTLDECKNSFGESIWYLRSSILLNARRGDAAFVTSFVDDCKGRCGGTLVGTIFNYFQLIADSGDAWLHLKGIIGQTIKEFDVANYSEGADLFSLMFSPNPLCDRRNYLSCLYLVQGFPFVDIYQTLLKIGQCLVVGRVRGEAGSAEASNLLTLIAGMADRIGDGVMLRTADLSSSGGRAECTTIGREILGCYEAGRYQDAIDAFERNLLDIGNPLAYVNVIAKSHAYLGTEHSLTEKSVIGQLLTSLKAIYRVSGATKSNEEAILSIAIQLNGLVVSAHIQMALYLALPQKYSDQDARACAALALTASSEVTPMVSALSDTINAEFGAKFGLESVTSQPEYRQIKRQVCEMISSESSESEIEERFRILKQCSPLPKDYYELYSGYCLYSGALEPLIIEVANSLSINADYESCFPLSALAEFLFQRRPPVSLEQLIVLFFYSKFVSSDKDDLLNEMFEDYLTEREAVPPSKLLARTPTLTPTEVVFFRDVCRLDVMDFLTCFDSVTELRSERLNILELLHARSVIDSGARMAEVEEIIGQVAVDSVSSKFNAAKIFVDDAALRSKLRDSISSLITYYGSAKADGNDRHTLLDVGTEEIGVALAYLSGEKNAIALRLITTLRSAFLFDEKFGLAKNLSTEIRHGFFSNLLKSRLEERHLLSERNAQDVYMASSYWRERNRFVPDEVWARVELSLNTFSAKFYELIKSAEAWMNIRESTADEDRAFVYETELTDIKAVREQLEQDQDVERLVAYVLGRLWSVTEVHLATMRDKLNGEFRQAVDVSFSDLLLAIGEAKGALPLVDLTGAIKVSREEIKNDITTAAEWFRRAAAPSLGDQPLDLLFQIAIRSFEEVNPGRSAIKLSLVPEFRSIIVNGNGVKPFIVAIINLLDNCYKHSGDGPDTEVFIVGSLDGSIAKVAISNCINPARRIENPEQLMSEVRAKLGIGRNMMKTEGGAGLGKANYQVSSITSGSRVDVEVSDLHFAAVIYYEP